jgi:TolB-like protein/class 3 adenylate cyclase/Flp pilus assembly protein TadD
MPEAHAQRRLAAILAADVVGFSRLMEVDEAGTLADLKALRRDVLGPLVARHQGRIFKTTGDGVLVEFGSAVNAVQCAVDLQREMAVASAALTEDRRIVLRIGVNLGDVMVEGGDLYGDSINIAVRLEALAEPGGIYVSAKLRDEIGRKLDLVFSDLGEQTLKNIELPVRVYGIQSGTEPVTGPVRPALALPDKPSIAVLPFQNMSGDPEQEYFADGMVEEIITALSRMKWLFVIARNSSFTYKGRAVDVKQVGRELGVRYVLEGSVRKAGNKVRITGQLIDASTGAHLWADRFEGTMDGIFELQDQVTERAVGAIAPKLEQAEIERARRKPTASLDAYDCYLRGLSEIHRFTKEGGAEALSHFRRAIELDPNFAAAYGMAARCYAQRKAGRWMTDPALEIAEAGRLARRAIDLGPDDAVALCTAGFALADVVDELADGDALIDQAIALNPNLAWAWIFSGWVKISLGEPEAGIERISHAMRLSPQDPYMFGMQSAMASAHLAAGRYAEALSWAEKGIRVKPNYLLAACIIAASRALAGRIEEARVAVATLLQIDPELRISNLRSVVSYLRAGDFAKWTDGLRKAGLPE